ncbi:MAG: hypothetical protein IKG93_09025 [Clostridiales bacterium]|nr:hypothetical protein [Clostridiales bacterium]
MRKINVLWMVSGLLLAGFLIVMLSGLAFGVSIPDTVVRICGVGALVSLLAFSFVTFRKVISKK